MWEKIFQGIKNRSTNPSFDRSSSYRKSLMRNFRGADFSTGGVQEEEHAVKGEGF